MTSASQQQNKQPPERRRSFKIRPAYIVLVLLMGLFAYKFVEKTQQIRALTAQEVALRQQNQTLENSRNDTRRAITQYRSPGYVEQTARAILGLTKPGETPVQVQYGPPIVEHFRAAPAPTPPASQPVWKQWWSAFFS